MPLTRLPKEEVLGRYRLVGRLGRGGMAEVFVGKLVGAGGFEKVVAIKRILSHLAEDPALVAMFHNEGRIAAELGHPNICQVFELGEEGGQLFLAMELLRGLTWSEIVPAIPDRPQAPFVRFIAGVIMQACAGLQHAHTANVVHRDVSPTNLFVTGDGVVKLLDFGVSKILTEARVTRTGMMKGKLAYMPPEQLRNLPVDARADLFGLAAVAWEAFAGRTLFDRDSDFEIMKAVIEDPIPALPGDGAVFARIDAVLRRSLSRDREQRHATPRELAGELRDAIAEVGAPMEASEIAVQLEGWLGPSLAKHARDLAELLGRPSVQALPPGASGEQTSIFTPAPEEGIRVRNTPVVVALEADVAATTEYQAAAATSVDTKAVVGEPSGDVTVPRAPLGDSGDVTVLKAPVEITEVPTAPRATVIAPVVYLKPVMSLEGARTTPVRPTETRSWTIVVIAAVVAGIVFALVAMRL